MPKATKTSAGRVVPDAGLVRFALVACLVVLAKKGFSASE